MLTAATIGIIEGLQTTGCRLAISDIRQVPRGVDYCEFVTGIPNIGHAIFAVYFLFVCYIIGRFYYRRRKCPQTP